MKLMTEQELLDKLCEAYRRAISDIRSFGAHINPRAEQLEHRLRDLVHADTDGHDGWGEKHG